MSGPADPSGADSDARIVLMTAPDPEVAQRIARALVEERLAACVNMVPGVRSIYRWQGAVEEGCFFEPEYRRARQVSQGPLNVWQGLVRPHFIVGDHHAIDDGRLRRALEHANRIAEP